ARVKRSRPSRSVRDNTASLASESVRVQPPRKAMNNDRISSFPLRSTDGSAPFPEVVSVIPGYSLQLGYTVHSFPPIEKVLNVGVNMHHTHVHSGVYSLAQGFQPCGNSIHVSRIAGRSTGLTRRSSRTVLPDNSSRPSTASTERRLTKSGSSCQCSSGSEQLSNLLSSSCSLLIWNNQVQ